MRVRIIKSIFFEINDIFEINDNRDIDHKIDIIDRTKFEILIILYYQIRKFRKFINIIIKNALIFYNVTLF